MFNSILGSSITIATFSICLITALVMGFIVSIVHMKTSRYNQNFATTLVILPALVTTVILLVNGNLGTGVAVAGAFSLVRFRSIPGNSKEIMNVFFAMAIGLACGTGYIGYSAIFTVAVALVSLILYFAKFGEDDNHEKKLIIVIPEDLDYTEVFEDTFKPYLKEVRLEKAKTINMGSMFELTYIVKLNNDVNEKELIDSIRVKNGNLKVCLSHSLVGEEL